MVEKLPSEEGGNKVYQAKENFVLVQFAGPRSVDYNFLRQGVDPFQLAAVATHLRAVAEYEILNWYKSTLPKVRPVTPSELRALQSGGALRSGGVTRT